MELDKTLSELVSTVAPIVEQPSKVVSKVAVSDGARQALRAKLSEAAKECAENAQLGIQFDEKLREIKRIFDAYVMLKGLGL